MAVLGLSHLHRLGIAYRGLSAITLLVTEGGLVQLVDFRYCVGTLCSAYLLLCFLMTVPAACECCACSAGHHLQGAVSYFAAGGQKRLGAAG
jgi:hypothetical protein